jgi:hypothetical protein
LAGCVGGLCAYFLGSLSLVTYLTQVMPLALAAGGLAAIALVFTGPVLLALPRLPP